MSDTISVEWEGRRYEVDLESVSPREFKVIKTHTGMRAGQFLRAFLSLDDFDADAAVALLWLCRRRAGDPSPDFRDDFSLVNFMASIDRHGPVDDSEDEGGEDPKAGSSTGGSSPASKSGARSGKRGPR